MWDGFRKKRLFAVSSTLLDVLQQYSCMHQFDKYPTSVSSLAFNAAGDMLAVASSYTYESGEKE